MARKQTDPLAQAAEDFNGVIDSPPEAQPKKAAELTVAQLTKECKRFDALCELVRETDKRLAELKAEKEKESMRLADIFIASGIPSHRSGGRLFSVRSKQAFYQTAGIDKAAACKALVSAKLGYLVTKGYNWQQLQSALKERAEKLKPGVPLEEALPTKMRDAFNVTEKAILVSLKSKT